ncbi:hypothetical protein ACFPM0_32360 [Pseudonocardia sulfidoxydans]|uniref:hypothetical protein n=1 Tax=Pseudonocardia sulfidoxydans TaxID=54011 RepID=UPI003614ABC7
MARQVAFGALGLAHRPFGYGFQPRSGHAERQAEASDALAGRAGLRDGGSCHPDDLPEGYHAADRGRSLSRSAGSSVEGRPRASARSGCARSTGWHWQGSGRRNCPGRDQMCDHDAAGRPASGAIS